MSKSLCTDAHTPAAFDHADLCAQVVPLNSYGPTALGAALSTGLTALAGMVKRTALAVPRYAERARRVARST